MKIETSFPVAGLRGTVSNSQLSYSTVQGEVLARAKVIPANPQTPEQLLVRSYMTAATKNWDTLTKAQREAWDAYARTYFADATAPTTAPGLSVYVRAQVNRQLLGLPLLAAAPTQAPPPPVTSITQVDALNPDTLGLTVTHTLTSVAGLSLVVRQTPATATLARRPQPTDLRYVKGATVASTSALPATGASVQFAPTRYSIEDGQRYGVGARIVRTADGIASLPITGDFIKVV